MLQKIVEKLTLINVAVAIILLVALFVIVTLARMADIIP
jgi:hypothetical protein